MAWEPVRQQLVRGVALLLVITGVLVAIVLAGRWSLEHLRPSGERQVAFDDIRVDPPPGLTRSDFLDEVRYLSRLPGSVPATGDHADLKAAFAKHPWVKTVDSIRTDASGLTATLTLRRPALAVPWQEAIRVVDEDGVLLPEPAPHLGLPRFVGVPMAPGPAGEPWPDNRVVEQAKRRVSQK